MRIEQLTDAIAEVYRPCIIIISFAGIWLGYGKSKTMTANWGDGRIPHSGDLDVVTSEFGVDSKYSAN